MAINFSDPSQPFMSVQTVSMRDPTGDQRRITAIREAWKAYNGDFTPPLQVLPSEPDLNVLPNRIAPAIDTQIAWLFGETLGMAIDPEQAMMKLDIPEPDPLAPPDLPDPSDPADPEDADADAEIEAAPNPKVTAAQAWLDGCWGDDDDRMTALAKHAINGKLAGHHFWKILPPDVQRGKQFPRLVELNPQNCSMVCDPEDADTVLAYYITYDMVDPVQGAYQKRQAITYKPAADSAQDTWEIQNYTRSGLTQDWTPAGPMIPWPHTWAPIVDGPNFPLPNQRWGRPDVTPDLIALNKAYIFVESNINAIGYSHGHPWLWASGVNVTHLKSRPGEITGIPNENGKMGAITASGDLPGLMQYTAEIRADMDERSNVPSVATGRMSELPKGQMSGVAIRMLYMPLIFLTTFERRVYGKSVREANMRMLALGGFGDGTELGGCKTLLTWQDPIPVDNLLEAQTGAAWIANGVSEDTIMEHAGFDPALEAKKKALASARDKRLMPPVQQLPMPANPDAVPSGTNGDPGTGDGLTPPDTKTPMNGNKPGVGATS